MQTLEFRKLKATTGVLMLLGVIPAPLSVAGTCEGGSCGGGGGMKQALRFEAKFPAYGLPQNLARKTPGAELFPSWLDLSLDQMSRGDQLRQASGLKEIAEFGTRIVHFLQLGDYSFPLAPANLSETACKDRSDPSLRDLEDTGRRFLALAELAELRGYSNPQLNTGIGMIPKSDIEKSGERLAAMNYWGPSRQAWVDFDPIRWRADNDCALLFEKNPTDGKKCHAVSANLIGAHEFLSLVGLERDDLYPYSLSLRYLLHDDDSAVGNFSSALQKGIIKFYNIDLNGVGPLLAKTYSGKKPRWYYDRREESFWKSSYRSAIKPRFEAVRDIEYILSRTRNITVQSRLLRIREFLLKQMTEINEYYKPSVEVWEPPPR